MLGRAGIFGALLAFLFVVTGPARAESPFRDWAAVVVAGDFQGSNGGPTEAFDNARRDIAQELQRLGFAPDNIRQFSVRPARYEEPLLKASPRAIQETLNNLATRAPSGCLVYFTSHGLPEGVVIDEQILPPDGLGRMLDRSCPGRPTIVIVSACYSGVFVRPLSQPNRMILTAARRDRTSFGCGEDSVYPFFDDCVLKSSPSAKDFAALASAVQSCVKAREVAEGMSPPSEPQVWIGGELLPVLPLYAFPRLRPGGD